MLGGLQKGSDVILKTLSEDREAAARYRTEIRAELAGLRNEYNAVQSDLKLIKDKVEKMEPKVENLEQGRLIREGAHQFAGFLGKAVYAIWAAIGGAVVVFIEKLMHK